MAGDGAQLVAAGSGNGEEVVVRRGRGRPKGTRRQVILEAAARLFNERGYHATGIDDIGEAAGITGPAVYRHFKSKDDLLIALIDQSADRAAEDISAVYAQGGSPQDMLEELVRRQIKLAVADAPLIAISSHELESLPPGEQLRLLRRDRLNREEWVHLLSVVRPDLADPEVRALVAGLIELLRGIATSGGNLPVDQLEHLAFTSVMAVVKARPKASRPAARKGS